MKDRTRVKARFLRYALESNPATAIKLILRLTDLGLNPEYVQVVGSQYEQLGLVGVFPSTTCEVASLVISIKYVIGTYVIRETYTKEELIQPLLNYIKKETKRKIKQAGHEKTPILGYYAN